MSYAEVRPSSWPESCAVPIQVDGRYCFRKVAAALAERGYVASTARPYWSGGPSIDAGPNPSVRVLF